MAYVERLRTNERRERQERDVFFAQSLTNRLLIREAPKVKGLRIGFEFIRSLEAGGDFFDLVPTADGGLFGFIGCCNGKGPRTVLEVTGIMRTVHRALHKADNPAGVLAMVNDYLVHEKRRAHQSSLAVFRVDPGRRALTVAKSGRVDMLLCGPGPDARHISAPGAMFLGMMDAPDIHQGEYDFQPGQSLFCVTEGLHSPDDGQDAAALPRWFMESVAAVLESRRRKPLANAIFDSVNKRGETPRPYDSLLAVSVEFAGRNRESMRLKAAGG
jgi:sigma-B regulation protein RsbU (phosphoserine phosphatase)